MKILLFFGTRPEAIKMAPIIDELKKQDIDYKIAVTAQHREMLDQVLHFFDIVPDFDLDIMTEAQTLNFLCAGILKGVDEILLEVLPDVVLVHGDTSTSVMAALASFHRGIPVGHVEAGLRTFNKRSPFPEEVNRQLTSRIADFHFAPSKKAISDLISEGIPEDQIFFTGNTIVDAIMKAQSMMYNFLPSKDVAELESIIKTAAKMVLVTGHRRENIGRGIEEICEALIEIVTTEDAVVIFPVHLNPEIQNKIKSLKTVRNIFLIDPVSYPKMLWLMERCDLIISDSGGIQEEAPSFGKTVIVTRDYTERPEGVERGFAKITGCNKNQIVNEAKKVLKNPPPLQNKENPYGDGEASKKIISILKKEFSRKNG